MRWLTALPIVLAAAFTAAGCGASTTTPDLAVLPPGCRQPSACFTSGCDCHRASLTHGFDPDAGVGCLVCDPTQQGTLQCDCRPDPTLAVACYEPGQLCVARGPVCAGAGARCIDPSTVPSGANPCALPGDPPQQAARGDVDGGPGTERRCAYVDDLCCPGPATGADLGVPDLGVPDLGGVD